MKKFLLFFLLPAFVLLSCKKDGFDPSKQAVEDDAAIQNYLAANNITDAIKDQSGLYYKILTPGTGDYPKLSSIITVSSTGKLLNGSVFDTETSLRVQLGSVIKGWQIGIPHINTGGRILLIVPSALGYGNAANNGIPKNSVLVFTVDLLGFED